MSTTKKAKVLRDFKDAGTEKAFASGDTVDLTEGEFINFAAAGLVEPAPAATNTETKADTKKA